MSIVCNFKVVQNKKVKSLGGMPLYVFYPVYILMNKCPQLISQAYFAFDSINLNVLLFKVLIRKFILLTIGVLIHSKSLYLDLFHRPWSLK